MTETLSDLTKTELARLRVMVKTFIKSAKRNPENHSQGYMDELQSILSKLR